MPLDDAEPEVPAAEECRSPPSSEPLSTMDRRCEFAAWKQRSGGRWRTRIKPDLFVTAWTVANVLIVVIALQKAPSALIAAILSSAPAAFILHAVWLLCRRMRLQVEPGVSVRWERVLGPVLGEEPLAGLRAIQLLSTTPETAADGSAARPGEQANLVFGDGDEARRVVLAEARVDSPEEANRLARELARILEVPFLDQRGQLDGAVTPAPRAGLERT